MKRKRSCSEVDPDDPEGVRPSKQLKSPGRSAVSDDVSPLSEANLRKHNKQTMSSTPSLKRTSSRRSTKSTNVKSDTASDSDQTTKSAISSSPHRFVHLANAGVCLNAEIPKDIRTTIDNIVERIPPQGRLEELKLVAKDLHNISNQRVRASDGEDDFVHLLVQALRDMKSDTVCYHEKADWNEHLKPLPPQCLNLDDILAEPPVANPTPATTPPLGPSPKRHQPLPKPTAMSASQPDPPPVSAMLPPSPDTAAIGRGGGRPFIKTPRPDISIGIYKPKLTSRHVSTDVSDHLVKQVLFSLQDQSKRTLHDRSSEPMLISEPASRASDLTFPFAVVEGKACSTGRPIFEAQNQAAVTGACALKIQLDLEDVTRRAERNARKPPTFSQRPPLLFFSVCTEGPIHELWAHFILEKENVPRTFASNILKICHTGLLDMVEKFIVALDNVCHWGTGPFLDYVVERLELVASSVHAK